WYGWTDQNPIPPHAVKTDKYGVATVPYPFYVIEKLETGTLCLEVGHPDYVQQGPERKVSTSLPHGAPWRTWLMDLFDRIRHHALQASPDPIVLEKGATLRITVTNAPVAGTGKFLPQVSNFYTDHDNWSEPAPGTLQSPQIAEGSHTVRVAFV